MRKIDASIKIPVITGAIAILFLNRFYSHVICARDVSANGCCPAGD